jgi:limonene-1,2-epoxide hydrolase
VTSLDEEATVLDAGEVVKRFYDAAQKKDLKTARTYLGDDLVFVGLFETYHGPEAYLAAFKGLLSITVRLDVKTIIAQGHEAAIFFELETTAPAAATTLVAEWHQVSDGKIRRVQSAFDGRPFAAMFSGAARRKS